VSLTPLLVDFIPANLPDSLVNFMADGDWVFSYFFRFYFAGIGVQ
jgi:hypothetical protein